MRTTAWEKGSLPNLAQVSDIVLVVLNEDLTCVGPESTLRLHSDFTCMYPTLRGADSQPLLANDEVTFTQK